ncbi:MAG: NAD(P)H-binding protein [Bacteroidota bacterium]
MAPEASGEGTAAVRDASAPEARRGTGAARTFRRVPLLWRAGVVLPLPVYLSMNLLVLGASGGCGTWLCRLASQRGHRVRALVRPSTPFDPPEGVEVVRGEVLRDGVLDRALDGCDAVLSALGIKRTSPLNPWSALASPPDLTTRVAERLVEAMPANGVRRVVAISAGGVADSRQDVHPLFRWLIEHSNMAASYADLAGMESVLASSDLDWMAVRPTTLTPGGPTGRVHAVSQYGLLARIPRSDVATWMLDAVEAPGAFEERTPMIAS